MELKFRLDLDKLNIDEKDLDKIRNKIIQNLIEAVNNNEINSHAWLEWGKGSFCKFASSSKSWNRKNIKYLGSNINSEK